MSDAAVPEFIALQTVLTGRYSLDRLIGRGGMGAVYLGRDVALDRPVAIKLLPPHIASPAARTRFLREARIAAALGHPNIVPIFTVEEHGDIVFFIMAYIEGETLRERVDRLGALAVPEATRVLQEVAWALSHAHGRSVIHRDIKPENILLERSSGRAMVTDFGVAHFVGGGPTATPGEFAGTPLFMSPEQASGSPPDARSDLYSLGVTAFFAVTGKLPFTADSVPRILAMHARDSAPPLASVARGVPDALAQAIDRCLLKDPAARIQTADGLAAALGTARALAPETPEILIRHRQAVRQFAVDTAGWGMLFGTLWFALGDSGSGVFFFNMRPLAVYVAILLEGVAVAQVVASTRQAISAGYRPEELQRVLVQTNARMQNGPPALSALKVGAFGMIFVGGISYWALGLGDWVADHTGEWLATSILLISNILPVVAMRELTHLALERAPLGARVWRAVCGSRFARSMLRLAGVGITRLAGAPPQGTRTEVVLGNAAASIYAELPTAYRSQLDEVPRVLARLEQHAARLREREGELDTALAQHPAVSIGEIEHIRTRLREQLRSVVAALENIRIDLLRLRSGVGSFDDITEALEAARIIGVEVDILLQARQETSALLNYGGLRT